MAATAAGSVVGGLDFFARPAAAKELMNDQKRVVLFNMHGGLSQLESWDPKPGTDTGGPFRAISTSVPGIQISELLPRVAKQMHHLCLVRGVNTAEDDHGKGAYLMTTGRRQTPAAEYPLFGAVCARRWLRKTVLSRAISSSRPAVAGEGATMRRISAPNTRASCWATGIPRNTQHVRGT